MKYQIRRFVLFLAAASAVFLAQAEALSLRRYDGAYRQVREAYDRSRKIRECPSRIVWDGNDVVTYTTRAERGEVFRAFTVSTTNLVDIDRARFDEIQKKKPNRVEPGPNPGFIHPSGTGALCSPDGKWTAFVRDYNVWVNSRETGDVQLSWDGSIAYDYISLMWSPDSQKLAALKEHRVARRQIPLVESHPADSHHGRMRMIDYAKPGDEYFSRTPALFLPAERKQVPLDWKAYESQWEVLLDCWLPDSSCFALTYVQRGFQSYRYVGIDAPSGRVHDLAAEVSDKFVFAGKMRHWWFKDGTRFLWISRRDNWRHLYLVNVKDGSERQLTKGDWNVRDVLYFSEKENRIIFLANGFAAAQGEDPYNRHVLALDLTTGEVRDLTPENAEHVVCLNGNGTFFTDYASRPDLAPTFTLRDAADGRVRYTFPALDLSSITDSPVNPPAEVFCAKGRDGVTDIWGTIWRPCNFNPTNKYPVIEFIYAGPHDSHVAKTFPINPPRGIELLASGFVIVWIDGMGTDNRSRTFHEVCWRNLKDAGFPDRIPWMQAAAKDRPWMDLSRVGIYGYSAGGQNAMGALLFHNDFYKAAVALCGCHDNRVDKLWWNEQWMGYPLGPWYAESSNVVNAHKLKGDLFLINGELDDNVDPISTLQVVDALVKANKDFEQLYLPGRTHNLGGEYIDRRVLDFFTRKLKFGRRR